MKEHAKKELTDDTKAESLQLPSIVLENKLYRDVDTDELVPTQNIIIPQKDFNFHKIWLHKIIQSLDNINNVKSKITYWIIEHLDRKNQLIMTQKAIAEQSGYSLSTVERTMAELQRSDPPFLIKVSHSVYRVNPLLVWKGPHNERVDIMYTFASEMQSKAIADAHKKAERNVIENKSLVETMVSMEKEFERMDDSDE